ncbi:hypothetical protein BY454_102119 [Marinobacter persicus]|uniref:Uncharacterized protein n=1 Tax=Marinobacter persicus TaxID=930118 RepID=A0A2S6GA10_9GAMM|nr:hypothetical protein BY455_102119 [Marinobacter persicus]PPK56155.1 hypothetical protein B0H24_1002119 [Marinobacter persicus]PPK59750.1 hypothetical protein BY454_102119 [Marinobacter persicus]
MEVVFDSGFRPWGGGSKTENVVFLNVLEPPPQGRKASC